LYNIYGLLKIASNVKSDRIFDIRFIDHEIDFLTKDRNPGDLQVDLLVDVVSTKNFKDLLRSYLWKKPIIASFSYMVPEGRSILHYQRFLGSNLGIYVENLEETTYVIITDTLFKFKFSIPIRELLTVEDLGHIILVKLLHKNCFVIHGALLDVDDHIISMVAMPDTGKTLTTLSLALESKAKIYADDMHIICADGKAWGLPPYRICLGTSSEKSLLRMLKFRRFRSLLYSSSIRYLEWIPYINIKFSNLISIPFFKFNELCSGCIDKGGGTPEYLFILERGGNTSKIEQLGYDETVRKILYTAMREWYYFDTNPILIKYAYANSSFNFNTLLQRRKEIIKKHIMHIPNIILIRAPSSVAFKDVIKKYLVRKL
jgi:hypothetical protein